MSGARARDDIVALIALGERREHRAAARLAEARDVLAERERTRFEQQERVDELQADIARLDDRRANGATTRSVDALRLEIERRRWLVFDLGKERFWLENADEALSEALVDVETARSAWLGVRIRRDALGQALARRRGDARRLESRREDALADDFRGAQGAGT